MFSDIVRNQGLFKAIFLIGGIVLLLFCFFLNVAEFDLSTDKLKQYYTFSARLHTSYEGQDCYKDIPDCNDVSLCKTVKTTPYLAGFALGFGGLVLLLSLGETLVSRVIKKYHIWIIQLVSLLLQWILTLLIPILYFTTKGKLWNLCWLPIVFEFIALISLSIASILYFRGNQSKGTALLQ